MEINANITNTVASSISKLNLSIARKAFESQKSKQQEEEITEEKPELSLKCDSQKSQIDVDDVQKYAKYMGENLSIDDINYALRYGRSVIADYSV